MSQQSDIAIARTVFEIERIQGITWFNLYSMQANPDKIQATVSRKKDFEDCKPLLCFGKYKYINVETI